MTKKENNLNEPIMRLMSLEDLDDVIEIEALSFKTPWSKESFESEIMHNNLARYLVLEHEGRVVAYAGMWIVVDEGHITNIAVHPICRGKGWGEKLVRHMVGFARNHGVARMTLEVRTTNKPAITLYEKIGFKSHGVRPGYYQDTGDDALIMWLEI